jgi:hypothetical protein
MPKIQFHLNQKNSITAKHNLKWKYDQIKIVYNVNDDFDD